jgi:hypothetical protein
MKLTLGPIEKNRLPSALCGSVREIGWRTWAHGGIDAMHVLLDAIEEAMPEAPSWAGSTLKRSWDGIGSGDGIWMM